MDHHIHKDTIVLQLVLKLTHFFDHKILCEPFIIRTRRVWSIFFKFIFADLSSIRKLWFSLQTFICQVPSYSEIIQLWLRFRCRVLWSAQVIQINGLIQIIGHNHLFSAFGYLNWGISIWGNSLLRSYLLQIVIGFIYESKYSSFLFDRMNYPIDVFWFKGLVGVYILSDSPWNALIWLLAHLYFTLTCKAHYIDLVWVHGVGSFSLFATMKDSIRTLGRSIISLALLEIWILLYIKVL